MNYRKCIEKYNLPSINEICNYYGQIKDNVPASMLDIFAIRYHEENRPNK